MGKVDENKQLKKQRLMEAAFELYTHKGIVQTSISDIVKEAKMAKGTFYLYFRDKYDLQEKLISHKAEKVFYQVTHDCDFGSMNTRDEKVLAIVDMIIDIMERDKKLLRFINKNLSWGVFKEAVLPMTSDLRSFFESILEINKDTECLILVFMMVEFINSTCHSVILENSPMPMDEFRPYLHQGILGILHSVSQKKGTN